MRRNDLALQFTSTGDGVLLQVLHDQGFLHSICHDFLLCIRCSRLLAYTTLLLDRSLRSYNEASNRTYDQIQVYPIQHRKTGQRNIPVRKVPLVAVVLVGIEPRPVWITTYFITKHKFSLTLFIHIFKDMIKDFGGLLGSNEEPSMVDYALNFSFDVVFHNWCNDGVVRGKWKING
ncbi:hypothetical protein PVK06_006601 [Gossypium arboreum]|uniref:Uncharacterized protein n=1 Tax=Gossypium arboreum TaxID=29729 RepID=A0ABR0QFQ5_GOSAR|nr:hypothetical protein PVK06_006601 [Gossypium arboreum]